jgi:probable selenium-dependent hydroxylase accessory protein YqeC
MTSSSSKPPDLYGLLSPLMKAGPGHDARVVAIVGGGGKTATLFSLAAAARSRGLRVAVTTTTHIRDPRQETGRVFDSLVLLDETGLGHTLVFQAPGSQAPAFQAPGITVFAAGVLHAEGRLRGIDNTQLASMCRHFDLVLVEADGSKGLPVKAPASHEPVVPPESVLLIGVVGLDCLGRPMDESTVHRPGIFGPLCGCAPGETIRASHIMALCQAGEGLFKLCPPQAAKVLLLNKSDLLLPDSSSGGDSRLYELYGELQSLQSCLDGYLVCSQEPGFKVLHQWFRSSPPV